MSEEKQGHTSARDHASNADAGTPKSAPFRLTPARLRILERAAKHERGLVTAPYLTGFDRVSWEKNAEALVIAGLLTPYVHGGFEITEAGRNAHAQAADQ